MFSRNKNRNRRLNRGAVLDVKLRSDQVRSMRVRALAMGLGLTFGTIFCFYLVWRAGEWGLNRLVYENNAFNITHLDVQTDGTISPDQLRRWANVRSGANLMALDLSRVKRDLELVPLVESVSVERMLPSTLRIRVTERVAVAQVNIPRARPGGGLDVAVMHLDAQGYVMLPLDPRLKTVPLGQVDETLPLVVGLNPVELQPGRRVDSPQVLAALTLVDRFYESPMAGLADLQKVDVTSRQVLVVSTGQGAEVTFGLEHLDQQLSRWRAIHDEGLRYHRSIQSLDLAVTNNIPTRWLEANALTPPVSKPAKPLRTRRNNV